MTTLQDIENILNDFDNWSKDVKRPIIVLHSKKKYQGSELKIILFTPAVGTFQYDRSGPFVICRVIESKDHYDGFTDLYVAVIRFGLFLTVGCSQYQDFYTKYMSPYKLDKLKNKLKS